MLFLFPRATSQVTACRHLTTAARIKYPAAYCGVFYCPGLAKIGHYQKKEDLYETKETN